MTFKKNSIMSFKMVLETSRKRFEEQINIYILKGYVPKRYSEVVNLNIIYFICYLEKEE